MTRVRALIAGCIGAFAFVAGAHAADPARTWRPPPPEPEYEKPEPRYRELMSGWYLRGDLGYRWNKVGSVQAPNAATGEKYPNVVSGTFGAGYKYQWFRADVTFDVGTSSTIAVKTASGTTQPQYTAKVGSMSLMANAYIDFGTWVGFTPYVGGGVGETQLKSANYHDTNLTGVMPPLEPGKAMNFTWAWMAGVAFQVQPSWMIDVNFRHLDMGDVPGFRDVGSPTPGATFKHLSTQEVRIGLRYLFE